MNKNFLVIKKMVVLMATVILVGCNNGNNPPVNPDAGSVITPPITETAVAKPVDGCTTYPASVLLPVPLIGQQGPEWCWAASGEMCMEALNGGIKVCQCDQANNVFSGGGCCSSYSPPPNCIDYLEDVTTSCNKPYWPDFKDYGFTSQSTVNIGVTGFSYGPLGSGQNYLSFTDLQNQISCLQKPVIFMWQWNINDVTDQAHMLVAYGYSINDSLEGQWVYVNDPGKTWALIPYSLYVSGNEHVHYADFYNITAPPANQ